MITHDSALLARAAAQCRGGLAFDLGTGQGEIPELVASINPGFLWIGVDTSHDSLCRSMAHVLPVLAQVQCVPSIFPPSIADLVTANPPYFVRGSGRPSPDPSRDAQRRGGPLLLYGFVFAAAHLLKPGGVFLISFRAGARDELMTAVEAAGIRREECGYHGKTGILTGVRRPA